MTMPTMTADDILRVDPGMNAALLENGEAKFGDRIEILDTQDVDTPGGKLSWTKVRLFVDGTPEGWVRSIHVGIADVDRGGPIDKLVFANQCWVEALFSDANPHYVAAVAEMRSATSDDTQAGTPALIGPFRFTQAEWDAARAVPEFGVSSYLATDISDWRMQVVLFTLMTHRTEEKISAELNAVTAGRRPSAAELYLAQLIGAKAAVAALTKVPPPTIKDAFDGVAAPDQAGDRPLGESNFGKIAARYAEVLDTGTLKGDDAIDRIVARLDPVLTTTKNKIIQAGTELLRAPVDDMTINGANSQFSQPFQPGATGTTFDQKAPVIMHRLLQDFTQFKDFHAAAILGNIARETGAFRLMQEVRPKRGRGGLGWLQWTGPRRVDFEQFCQPPNPSTATDEGNYTFMVHEMRGKEHAARQLFEVTQNLDDATTVFMSKYERPGVEALPERKDFARRALSLFHAAAPPGGGQAGGAVVSQLVARIATGKIIFDDASLKDQLLGLNAGVKVTAKLQALVLQLCALTPVIRISSLVRSGAGSFHTMGRAVDIGNEEIAAALLPQIATAQKVAALGIDELIFDARRIDPANDPNKFNFDQGVKHNFDPATIGDHGNHIHFAVTA
jgi:hypothetical protein